MTAPLPVTDTSLYEEDFLLWIEQQMALLRAGRLDRLDLANLIEELESMGRSEKKSVFSNMRVVLVHLLKLQFQPEKATRSWTDSVIEHRARIRDDFATSPSLRRYSRETLLQCYDHARAVTASQTRLPLTAFPETCPYSFEQVLDPEFLPGTDGDDASGTDP